MRFYFDKNARSFRILFRFGFVSLCRSKWDYAFLVRSFGCALFILEGKKKTMDKSEVIRELRAKKSILQRIESLEEQCRRTESEKQSSLSRIIAKGNEHYQYNDKLRNDLPVDNAERVRREIDERRRGKRLKSARIVVSAIVLISIAVFLVSVYLFYTNFLPDDFSPDKNSMVVAFSIAIIIVIILAGKWAYSLIKQFRVGLIVAGALLLFYAMGFMMVLVAFQGAAICLVTLIPIVFLILYIIKAKKKNYSSLERRQIDEAKRKDAENRVANEKRLAKANTDAAAAFERSKKSSIAQFNWQVEDCNAKIDRMNREINELKKQTHSEIISDRDNNLRTVTLVLDYLETGRADTLKEALRLADVIMKEESINNLRLMTEQWEREDAELERRMQIQERRDYEYRIQSEQRRHNEQLEKEAYEARKALEEIQKKLNS